MSGAGGCGCARCARDRAVIAARVPLLSAALQSSGLEPLQAIGLLATVLAIVVADEALDDAAAERILEVLGEDLRRSVRFRRAATQQDAPAIAPTTTAVGHG